MPHGKATGWRPGGDRESFTWSGATGIVHSWSSGQEVVHVLNRRFLQGVSVAFVGLALACAPMAAASAHNKPKHKPAKHHSSKTVAKTKGGSNPNSSICTAVSSAQNGSSGLSSSLEKAFAGGGISDFASAKQAMLNAMNTALKEEGPAESALRSAPANVQAAMKGLFAFETSFKTAVTNATSATQLVTSLSTLGQNPQLEADGTTIANYVTSLCGATTTTTIAIP
jgi:hypothetical protein